MRALPSLSAVLAVLMFATTPTRAQSRDSSDVAGTIERFHRALAEGDSLGALGLLADDVVILESGDAETRDQYRSHHLSADIAFARAVRSERTVLRLTVQADVATVATTSTTQGTFRERAIDSVGAELMVLTRTVDGWTIRAIHWSSHSRRPAR